MRNIVKILSLLSIIAVIPASFAATSRVSVTSKASPRLPSIASRLISGTTTTTTTSSTAAYYGDSECIEKYTDCIKADDVCGSDMQECTTNVLFHGQMANCLSVLYQCSSSGINALFGTTAINALSNVAESHTIPSATRSGATEVVVDRYTYPANGSVLGQLIIGAGITNKLTTEQCVRRYTNCLQRDDICGADFELCTSAKTFKKQALLCDSTLQRCQETGKTQLFGSVANANNLTYAGDSRIGTLVAEGASTAALNAVKTCQKVTDNCLVNACAKNPLSCVEGTSLASIDAANIIAEGTGVLQTSQVMHDGVETASASDVRKLLKTACLETIGSNRYCHMTYREKVPSDRELGDPDLQEEVFSLAYSARKSYANTKIQEAMKKFDTKAKNACVATIKECAMRSCGGGLGSVCYTRSKSGDGVHVNDTRTYGDILSGCSAIVNADANCIYAATSAGTDGYTYTYYDEDGSTFNTLFPQYSDSASDPIGAVATLNSLLATSYNPAAIENMKKQCQTIALSCVKAMCGKEYVNCYRSRTDIVSGTYDTDNARLDRSMNKMGGVLDYNIVIGLCMNTVRTSSVCEEHLKIAIADQWPDDRSDTTSWNGYSSVREAWRDANSTKVTPYADGKGIVIACAPASDQQIADAVVSALGLESAADCTGTMEPIVDSQGNTTCDQTVIDPETACIYDQPVYQSQMEYMLTNAGTSLFQTLLADVEKEVQAIYNAKLTKEQRVCLGNNNGGIMGNTENGSTFMWVKLRNSKVPKNYVSKGLTAKQFVASNDLYGSFCRARITVQSDDKDIQDLLKNNSVAYFAVGDSFTCGSWISDSDLRKISDTVGNRELCKQGYGQWDSKTGKCDGSKLSTKEKIAYAWGTVAPALAGTGIGLGLTESGVLGKWVNSANETNSKDFTTEKNKCISMARAALSLGKTETAASAETSLRAAYNACEALYDKEGVCQEAPSGLKNDEASATLVTSVANGYIASCQNAVYDNRKQYNGGNKSGTKNETNMAARVTIPIVTGFAAGGLGAGITASVIKQNRENIKNTAAQQWMDEIGEHIQCYIGTEELGTYGDVVSIELD